MRGYGDTDALPNAADYSQEPICAEMLAPLDALGIEGAVFVGHDWGGAVVSNVAKHHLRRCSAVAGINTRAGRRPPIDPLEAMRMGQVASIASFTSRTEASPRLK